MSEWIATPPHYLVPSHLGPDLAVSIDRRWRAVRSGEVWHLYDDGVCVRSTGEDLHEVQRHVNNVIDQEAVAWHAAH